MDGIFKTAMNGFKKGDVLEFIDQQENEFKKNEKVLKDTIEELKSNIEDQKIEKEDLLSRIQGLEQALERESNESLQAQQRLLEAETQAEATRNELGESKCIIEELKRENMLHKQELSDKAAQALEKAAEIERLSNTISSITTTQQRISRVMVEAQNTADKIIDGAKKEAADILGEAEKKLARMIADAAEFKTGVDELREKVDGFSGKLSELSGELTGYAADIGGAGGRTAGVPAGERPAEEQPGKPAAIQKPAREQGKNGHLFNFSLGSNMFNWDKN